MADLVGSLASRQNLPPSGVAPTLLRLARRLDSMIRLFATGVGITALCGLFVTVSAGVALRYLSSHGAGWVNELPYLFFPWLCAMAFVVAAQFGAHIIVEMVPAMLPRRAALLLSGLVQILSMATFGWLAFAGAKVMEITASEFYPILRVPTAWAYAGLTTACVLLTLTSITGLVRLCLERVDPAQLRQRDNQTEGVEL